MPFHKKAIKSVTSVGKSFVKDPLGSTAAVLGGLPGLVTDVVTGGALTDKLDQFGDFLGENLLGNLTPKERRLAKEEAEQQTLSRRFDQARAGLELSRERSRLVRENRLAVAATEQAGQDLGVAGSTAVKGKLSSIRSSGASELGFLASAQSAAAGAAKASDRATEIGADLANRAAANQRVRQGIGLGIQAAGVASGAGAFG